MPYDHPEQPDPDSLARARRINAACERHEAAWRAGRRPRIEDELVQGTAREQPELLAELLSQPLCGQARDNVGPATGREAHNDLHGSRRIGLSPGKT